MQRFAAFTIFSVTLTWAMPVSAAYQERLFYQQPEVPSARDIENNSVPESDPMMQRNVQEGVLLPGDNPEFNTTRAAFVAMIVRAFYPQGEMDSCFADITSVFPVDFTLLFTDTPRDHEFGKELCVALRDGIIRGYRDGSFRPNATINFAEASKVLGRVFVLSPYADSSMPSVWFRPYVESLSTRNAIPTSIKKFDQALTREEALDMFNRLFNDITWQSSQSWALLERNTWGKQPNAAQSKAASSATNTSSQAASKPQAASSASKASEGSLKWW